MTKLTFRQNFASTFWFKSVFSHLSPPQRPLCIVGKLLCCGEAGEKEKGSARGTMGRGKREEVSLFPSSPARFLFLSIIDILIGIPSGSLCGGESSRAVTNKHTNRGWSACGGNCSFRLQHQSCIHTGFRVFGYYRWPQSSPQYPRTINMVSLTI